MDCKTCSRCNLVKSFNEFYACKSSKDGKQAVCACCQRQYVSLLHKNNTAYQRRQSDRRKLPEFIKRQSVLHRKRVHSLREIKVDYLKDKKCIDCGEQDPLVFDFDHVRGEKKYSICTMIGAGFPWLSILAEIEKCEIRCANCHSSRTFITRGWGLKPNDKHKWINIYKEENGCFDCGEKDFTN